MAPPSRSRTKRLALVTALLTLTLLGNEFAHNLLFFGSQLGSTRVVDALADNLSRLVPLLGQGLVMLVLVALLSVGVSLLWASISLAVFDSQRARLLRLPLGRFVFWFGSSFAFFHSWYSAHQLILPGSHLSSSSLFQLVAALRSPFPKTTAHLAPTVLMFAVTLVMAVLALRKSRALRVVVASALVTFSLAGWLYSQGTALGRIQEFRSANNIILLGLDSFQMNRLAVGGSPENLAPNVSRFLEQSYRFDNAWTPFARTYPSWISILTGRYPPNHGVRFNLMPDAGVSKDNLYLPALLGAAGYTTFYATDEPRFSIIRPLHGYDRLFHPRMGLEDFVLATFFDFSAANLARQTHLGHDLFPAIANNRASVSYNPRIYIRNLLKEINRLPADRPLFLTVHLCGNHWPFSTIAPYSWQREEGIEQAIMMVDDQVATLLDYFRETRLMERSMVVMLSDHGDGWSGDPDSNQVSHGNNFRDIEASRVVLGFRGAGIESGVSDALVRTIDIHPTILELAGLDSDDPRTEGRSLLPALQGMSLDDRSLFAETGVSADAFDVERTVEANVGYYDFDRASGLMQLSLDGVARLTKLKSYMYIANGHRLVVTPVWSQVELIALEGDSSNGFNEPTLSDDLRLLMLEELAGHFGLDKEELTETATRRGFFTAQGLQSN